MKPLFGLRAIAWKELVHIRRDPTTLVFALLIPLVQLMLFGFAVNFDVRHIATVVVDMDHSRESRAYVQSLVNTEDLDVTGYVATPDMAEQELRSGTARVAVLIPPDFSESFGTPHAPTVHVLIDGSDSTVANPARAAFMRAPMPSVLKSDSDVTAITDAGEIASAVQPQITYLFNPQMRTALYTIPGLVGVILQLVTVTLTSFSLVREREQGSLDQLMVSPVGKLGLILGKLLPYFVLATLELVAVLTFAHVVFDISIAGSFVLLFLLSLPYILAALATGLLISTLAQNQAQALQMTILTILPAVLLSGYIAPRETLPGPLYLISNVQPVTYFIQIMRGIVVRGAGFTDLLPSVLSLTALTVVLLTAATVRFRKSAE